MIINPSERNSFDALVSSGILHRDELEKVFKDAAQAKLSLSEFMVRTGRVRDSELPNVYAKHFKVPAVQLKSIETDRAVIEKVPVKFSNYYKFFPIKIQNHKLTIAISQPLDVNTLDEIRLGLGFDVEFVFSSARDIEEMTKRYYGLGAETVDRIMMTQNTQNMASPIQVNPSIQVEDIEKLAETASVVQLVNQIILDAYRKGASDIHVEPYRGRVRLRYRIDGVLQEARVPPDLMRFFMAILSRIKIMANLNIVERRMPQDGKARVKTQDQTLDLRISSIPTPLGESMVIRILPSKMILSLEELGFEQDHLKIFRDLLKRPHGVIFLTGPTGSGKSTTLYSGLHSIDTLVKKVVTIEDPIEYEIEGITQVQVMPEIGLTFARGLRSMLRHDPDIMMVGEVRDLETADIAIRAALTGHLILSTLHTNDAASGITRLIDIGVQPYMVSSSVIAFIAQRLVRVICANCKQEDKKVPDETLRLIKSDLNLPADDLLKTFTGIGCDECNQTGFRGRVAVHEIILINEEIRKLVYSKASAEEIKLKGRSLGMRTLRQDGWKKVLRGITTANEVMEITPADEFENQDLKSIYESVVMTQGPLKQTEEFIERRRYPRTLAKFPVTYRAISQSASAKKSGARTEERVIDAQAEDLSASGMIFSSSETAQVGELLEFKLEIPDKGQPIQCIGRVLRVDQAEEHSPLKIMFTYRISVTFLSINSVDRARIESFCQERAG